jgi:hypothetical protein
VPAQHRRLQPWIGHQRPQPFHWSVDPQRIDHLDWHSSTLTQRLDRFHTAHRRAGQDAADPIVTQAGEQAMGLMVAGNRQGAVVITAGPLVLVAGMRVPDKTDHRGSFQTPAVQRDDAALQRPGAADNTAELAQPAQARTIIRMLG